MNNYITYNYRRWFLQSNLHIWFLVRENVVRRDISIDHQRGEWGTVALLAIALVLLTNTLLTWLMYGYLGNGVIGPFSVACVPPLIFQAMSLVVYPLTITLVLDKHRNCLRELDSERTFISMEIEETKAPLISFDDISKHKVYLIFLYNKSILNKFNFVIVYNLLFICTYFY